MATETLSWPGSVEEWQGFLSRWGLSPETAVRALALGHYVAQLTGKQLRITSGLRSKVEQAQLQQAYKAGTPGIYKPATNSKHISGKAFDCVFVDGGYPDAMVGKIANALGLRWGGSFADPDRVHFDAGV